MPKGFGFGHCLSKPSTYFFLFLVAAAFLAMYWFSVNVPFRTGSLLRRNGPVPSIQSSEPAGAILDKSERGCVGALIIAHWLGRCISVCGVLGLAEVSWRW